VQNNVTRWSRNWNKSWGGNFSNNAISLAVHQSRAEKVKGISTMEVRERQLAQLSSEEQQSLQNLCSQSNPSGQSVSLNRKTRH